MYTSGIITTLKWYVTKYYFGVVVLVVKISVLVAISRRMNYTGKIRKTYEVMLC